MSRLVIIVVLLLISLSLGVVLVWPKYQDFQVRQSEIQQKEEELNSRSEYFSKIRDISAELDQYEDNLAKISTALPNEVSLPPLFDYFQQVSAQTGLVMENIEFAMVQPSEEEKEPAKFKKIDVSLELSGSYPALKAFLSAVEKSARFFEVKTINFSSPKESKEAFSFDLDIVANSY